MCAREVGGKQENKLSWIQRKHVFQERYQCYRGLKTTSVLVEIILTLIDGIISHFLPIT